MSAAPLLSVLVCVAAGAAGWCGAGYWRDVRKPDSPGLSDSFAKVATAPALEESALRRLRMPGQGSARLSEMAALIARLPEARLEAVLNEVAGWPFGAGREIARALLRDRIAGSKDPTAELVEPEPEAESVLDENRYEGLAKSMAEGYIHTGCGVGGDAFGPTWGALGKWVSMDPAAATEAILKMPRDSTRNFAVDFAAGVMAHDQPLEAMALLMQSGEKHLGDGAASVWLRLAMSERSEWRDALKKLTPQMSAAQQDSLAAELAAAVRPSPDGMPSAAGELNDADLLKVWQAARTLPKSDARQALVRAIGERSPEAFLVPTGKEHNPDILASAALVVDSSDEMVMKHHYWENKAMSDPAAFLDAWEHRDDTARVQGFDGFRLDQAAPRILPNLCRTGHLTEAVQFLDHLQDRESWSRGFQAVLPYWMDADPAAARSAFISAPLTALERERWERHPAFLLHP